MREYIQEFFTRFAYPCDSAETLLKAYEKLEKGAGFLRLIKEYETQGINCDFDGAFLALKEIANSVRVHEYSAVLLYFICLAKHLKTLYEKSSNILDRAMCSK